MKTTKDFDKIKEPKKKILSRSKKKKPMKLKDRISKLLFHFLKRDKQSIKRGKSYETIMRIGQYQIEGKLCDGTFGKIMLARDINTQVMFAAKLEPYQTIHPQLMTEYKIYEILGHAKDGFMKIFHYGQYEYKYNVLIMELLGPDLEELFLCCKSVFSYKTVLIIALQTIKLIKYVHDKGIIYRDIKPENFCIGTKLQECEKIIYIIDFGLSKILRGKGKQSGAPHVDYDYLVGTARYMSISAHYGIEQSKRDDLESLGYMYMYFLNGRLPWMGITRIEDASTHYRHIAEMKNNIVPGDLVRKHPEFVAYMKYVSALKFGEEPSHEFVYNLMKDRFIDKGFEYDGIFDWTDFMNRKYLQKSLDVDPDE